MINRHSNNYHFIADSQTGMTMRWGITPKDNPRMAPVPELADISISNHCTKGCSFCYRNSVPNEEFMSVDDYCYVLDSMTHKDFGGVFQVALGGGEPLEHPDFIEIINATVAREIVPNFTTNGIHLTQTICDAIRNKVGAVALSTIRMGDIDNVKLNLLLSSHIRTNIHYLLSSMNIEEAIKILQGEYNEFLKGVNAVIFLTFKPAGRGQHQFMLKNDTSMQKFINLIELEVPNRPKIGFDACFIPMLLSATHIRRDVVDVCEGGFFSVYIDHKMNVSPCSFSGLQDSFNLKEYDFFDIWNNKFEEYRQRATNNCTAKCAEHDNCHGCCAYYPEITTCYERAY